jgi:hypothetical protein
MPAAYPLAADGLDVYRNFVVPAPVRERRYVRALEFRPESRAVHHVFIKVDPSPQSRLRDELDEEPGFPGFYVESARMPEGQFVTWQPGKGASTAPPGMPWVLEPECDVIIQTHLQPIGRAETIRSRIGLYFTNQPPVRSPFKLALMSFQIDIPPGATNHLVTDSFVLPADVDLLAVLPHGHLLGKSFAAEANLPDGGSLPLLSISDWDFNWQGDYSYREPVFLPQGTVLQMRYTFDNSTNNLRNPHQPPQRVRYGPNSTDEMAEFWLQLLPRTPGDRQVLAEAYNRKYFRLITEHSEQIVRERPNDLLARLNLGRARLAQGRIEEARAEVERAVAAKPDSDDAHYLLGVLARMQNRLPDAEREFEAAIRLNPANAKAHGNLGLVLMQRNQLEQAQAHLERALQLNSQDEIARSALDQILKR